MTTPFQAYKLAMLFASRTNARSVLLDSVGREIAAPQAAGPAGERALRDSQRELACHTAVIKELRDVETHVRRILGLDEPAQEQGGSDAA